MRSRTMTKYFFHIQDQFGHIPDEEGAEFESLDQAKEEAVATARDIAKQWLYQGHSPDDPCVEIRNSDGEVITALSVREVLAHPVHPKFQPDCEPQNAAHEPSARH